MMRTQQGYLLYACIIRSLNIGRSVIQAQFLSMYETTTEDPLVYYLVSSFPDL